MDNIYDLYRNDGPGLEAITSAFFTQLQQFSEQAILWAEQGNREALHRGAHQLKTTATMYELNELTTLLGQIASDTRSGPDSEAAGQVKQYCVQLPRLTDAARQQVAQKLPHVLK
ncbi:MAG: Hpt domain-containing protein [Dinghuibacter sp.]|nr:Hpt domain-containing protein [Dinghuibacter sp.]